MKNNIQLIQITMSSRKFVAYFNGNENSFSIPIAEDVCIRFLVAYEYETKFDMHNNDIHYIIKNKI